MRINMKLLTAADIVLPNQSLKIDPNIISGKQQRTSQLHWPKEMELPENWKMAQPPNQPYLL